MATPAQRFTDLGVWQNGHAHSSSADLSRTCPMNAVGDRLDEVARMLDPYTRTILDSRF